MNQLTYFHTATAAIIRRLLYHSIIIFRRYYTVFYIYCYQTELYLLLINNVLPSINESIIACLFVIEQTQSNKQTR